MMQVEWEPYGRMNTSSFGYHGEFQLNPACLKEQALWCMQCPLVCMWAVEHHMPQRVMRQFGLRQECPPEYKNTNATLHE